MIYFDNAATTFFKPHEVIDAVTETLTKYSFNPNRGGFSGAIALEQKILGARKRVSALLNNDSENNVVFGLNCTSELNLAILGTIKRKGHIVTTVTEHNSVLRPVMQLKRKGFADVTLVTPDEKSEITAAAVENAIRPETYLVIISHVSNVTGKAQDLATIGNMLKKNYPSILFVADCAQSAGYISIDMQKMGIDMAAIPAHKGLHGIEGCGALAFTNDKKPKPVLFGGTGTESHILLQPETVPDGLEAGTLPCPAITALSAAIDWWAENWRVNIPKIRKLQEILQTGLTSVSGVKVYSQNNSSGIAAFNIGKCDSGAVADALNSEFDIAVRAGLHCAPLMHKYLGTFSQGVIRASVACDNTEEQCYKFLNCVESLAKRFS